MAAIAEESPVATTTANQTDPDSPPGLSYGKSPKSSTSSLRSDSDPALSDTESTEKLGHFGEVAISDAGRDSLDDSNLKPESRPTLRRPSRRSSPSLAMRKTSIPNPLRDVAANENRPPHSSVSPHGVVRDQSLNLPGGGSLRRSVTSTSTPSLYSYTSPSSRSPSPTKPYIRNGFSMSPQMRSTSSTSLTSEDRSPSSRPMRPSWHPRRKSVRELEDECNDDEDEEVPDDAVLENVPISPMPGGVRTPRLSSRSNTPSPHRRASASAHANLHSANVPKNAKRPSAPPTISKVPRSPRNARPSLPQPHSPSSSSAPEPLWRKGRSKSWTEDLSHEARELTAALEEYADQMTTEKHGPGSGYNSASSSPPRPTVLKQRAMTQIVDLSMTQRGNIIIDPFPMSKEKEALISKTRPSWLPPKSQKEERRHLREWEQMMAKSVENEKKRAQKAREDSRESRSSDETTDSIARIWDQHVLPNWDQVIQEPRTRELWWRGVTPRSRAVVWPKALGNELGLTDASFDAALSRALALESHLATLSPAERSARTEAAWFDAIARDVPAVFAHQVSADNRPAFESALARVLKAYALYRSDVGYVYGVHRIAAFWTLQLSSSSTLQPAKIFIALANALNRPLPLAFLTHERTAMARYHALVLDTLAYKFPRLHAHLTSTTLGLNAEEYLDPIFFRSLFVSPSSAASSADALLLPPSHIARIWDLWLFEGDKALIRAAVAVLGALGDRLLSLKKRAEILAYLGWVADSDPSEAVAKRKTRRESDNDLAEKSGALGVDEEGFIRLVREAGKVGSAESVSAGASMKPSSSSSSSSSAATIVLGKSSVGAERGWARSGVTVGVVET